MTSRERVLAILKGEKPDRIPFNFWMDRDIMIELDCLFGENFRVNYYGADVIEAFAFMDYFPQFQAEYIHDEKTSWQVKAKVDDFSQILEYPIPRGNNPEIYANIRDTRNKYPDKAIFAMMMAPLGIISNLKMPEDFYIGLMLESDIIHEILCKIKPTMIEIAENTCKEDIDVLYLAEDFCMATGLMYSQKMLKEFHFEYMKDVIQIAHDAGKKVFYHTDGFIMDAIDLFIEYKIDGINPVEPRYNDSKLFSEKTKGKLMVYGGIDNCNIIPNGTFDEIEKHLNYQFQNLGKNGGLIFSSHDIPSCCPIENLDFMVKTIKNMK